MADFENVLLPQSVAMAHLRRCLSDAGKLAGLINIDEFGAVSAIAPATASAEELVAFEAGKLWKMSETEGALIRIVGVEFQSRWWGLYQNVFSNRGDLPADEFLGDHVFVDDCYIHTCADHNKLDTDIWLGNAVGFLKIMFLSTLPPSAYSSGVASTMSTPAAERLASSVFCIIANAYDDESWIIARRMPKP